MARTCPRCGAKAIDDQSMFCNKCGSPFAEDQPKKVLVRTTPRPAESVQTPPPQPALHVPPAPEPPATDPVRPPVLPTRAVAEPPSRIQSTARQPAPGMQAGNRPLPFQKVISRRYPRAMYWVGVIAILLIVFSGITADMAKSGKTADTSTGTGAEDSGDSPDETAATPKGDLLAGIPLFWIGVLVIANLAWRVLCEIAAAVHSGSLPSSSPGENLLDNRMEIPPAEPMPGPADTGGYAECPRCGKNVPVTELKKCEICGTEGCTSCIRLMGLVRKKWTCRDCFEKK